MKTYAAAEHPNAIRKTAVFAMALAGLLLLAWQVYRPGLNGPFLFDDFVNLNALGSMGPIHSWASFFRYVTSGDADPTGRPLTLLSFLIDAQNWPADSFSFKRTNVLLHLLNGVLLCWVMLKLGERLGLGQWHNRTAALLGSGIWLLHPLFISTTLYIVQREAMLPTTFSLCGILLWCAGRRRLEENHVTSAWIWMTSGSLLCGLLATLCKANGALLPLLILTAEFTILRFDNPAVLPKAASTLRQQRLWLLAVPALLLTIYLLSQFPAYIHTANTKRSWTIGQRLLTEPRILINYLRLLWLPQATSQGIFNDQIMASIGSFTPWTTLPSLFAILGLCSLGCWLRKRSPILAFAILFYFAGQLMESTFIPLELFFEHRNYLPAVFMFWPLAIWLTKPQASLQRKGLAILALAIVAILTWSGTQVWGNSREQALIWATINPDSPRAQAVAASTEMAHGNYAAAITRLRLASTKAPSEVQLTLNLVDAECATGHISPDTWQLALFSLKHTTNASESMLSWFSDSIQRAQAHVCGGLTLMNIHQALQSAQANPLYEKDPGFSQDLAHISGLLALAEGQPQTALDAFNHALMDRPNQGTALAQAALLGAGGYAAFGLRHLEFAQAQENAQMNKIGLGMPRLHDWILSRQGYWQHEASALRATLTADAAQQATESPPNNG